MLNHPVSWAELGREGNHVLSKIKQKNLEKYGWTKPHHCVLVYRHISISSAFPLFMTTWSFGQEEAVGDFWLFCVVFFFSFKYRIQTTGPDWCLAVKYTGLSPCNSCLPPLQPLMKVTAKLVANRWQSLPLLCHLGKVSCFSRMT